MPAGTVDVAAVLASPWPSPSYRAALMLLESLDKPIPGEPSDDPDDPEPFQVDWDELERWAGPWSTTERIRVRLARSFDGGDLADAAWSFDHTRWALLLEALDVARHGVDTGAVVRR